MGWVSGGHHARIHPDDFFSGATKSGTFPSLIDSSCRWWSMIVAGYTGEGKRQFEIGEDVCKVGVSETRQGYLYH